MSEYLYVKPEEIERKSFEIIGDILQEEGIILDEKKAPVIKRVIHTSADFSYVETLKFSDKSMEKATELIKSGASIITDTNMALSGINKKRLEKYSCKCYCFMADEDIAKKAKEVGTTRAVISMQKALSLDGPKIIAIGNAPTALLEIDRLVKEGERKPDLVIGVPVGFVNVEYAKEVIIKTGIEYIVNIGRKGGSNIAAAIINALVLACQE